MRGIVYRHGPLAKPREGRCREGGSDVATVEGEPGRNVEVALDRMGGLDGEDGHDPEDRVSLAPRMPRR